MPFKPMPGAFHVYRYGDTQPTALADELKYAKDILIEDDVEGDVRDFEGRVLWRHVPKKPLERRLADATAKLTKATNALQRAQHEHAAAARTLARLKLVESDRAAAQPQQALLIGGDS